MLKAYEYVEFSDNLRFNMGPSYSQHEEALARDIVDGLKHEEKSETTTCICGEAAKREFFTKWGVTYYRCLSCFTITAGVAAATLESYKKSKALIEYRTSAQYQEEAGQWRNLNWDELIDWFKFRTFRYLDKKAVKLIDYGNRYLLFADKIANSGLCESYELRESILEHKYFNAIETAEVVLYINNFQQSIDPEGDLLKIGRDLKQGGLLFLGAGLGTGFDILMLKEHAKVFPYEHIFFPSLKLLCYLLRRTGYKVLDVSTPGRMDTVYVAQNADKILPNDYFIKYLMTHGDKETLQEFQRFLQKSGMSSYARIVAQKV